MSVGRFFQGGDLFRCGSIFALGVVRGFHLHFAQGDDVRSADNPDIFAARGSSQPPAQVFLGIRDCESLHKDYIQSQLSSCQGPCFACVNVLRGLIGV